MMSPRRRNTYLVLIGAGAAALLIDSLVPQGTAPTQDFPEGGVGNEAQLVANAASAPGGGALPVPELPFPDLGLQEPPKLTRDPFRRPGPPDNASIPADTSQTGEPRITSHVFRELHRLEGVLLQERLRIAIINGAWIRIGQSVGGCTLTAVTGTEARFSCDDGEATLQVGGSSSRAPH